MLAQDIIYEAIKHQHSRLSNAERKALEQYIEIINNIANSALNGDAKGTEKALQKRVLNSPLANFDPVLFFFLVIDLSKYASRKDQIIALSDLRSGVSASVEAQAQPA